MIVCDSEPARYRVRFSDGTHTAYADTTPEKGGGGAGFSPFALLEAALGTCLAITLEMYASAHSIPLDGVTVTVEVHRNGQAEPVYEYAIELRGELSPAQRDKLRRAAKACPVHKTLAGKPVFREADPA
jgi:putative redox protein